MSEPHRHTGAVTKVAGPIVTDYDHGKPWWQNDRVPFESSLSSHDRQMRATRLSTGIGRLALIRAGGIGLVALTVLFYGNRVAPIWRLAGINLRRCGRCVDGRLPRYVA